jgi:4-hydroxy-tetrahydrodipicolinate reductase
VARLAREDSALELVGGLDRGEESEGSDADYPVVETLDSAAGVLEAADAVIDFSAPEFLRGLLTERQDALAGRALVVGTTGLGAEEEKLLDSAAERSPVLLAANFSIAVNLLSALAEQAARVLGDEYDVEIVEAHHRRKVDAPSGTALALGHAVARGREVELDEVRRDGRSGHTGERPRGEIGFHSLRGGDMVGEHRVQYIGERDRIELTHVASDRALFAAGALRAARWLAGRAPGRYTMRDVLGLE